MSYAYTSNLATIARRLSHTGSSTNLDLNQIKQDLIRLRGDIEQRGERNYDHSRVNLALSTIFNLVSGVRSRKEKDSLLSGFFKGLERKDIENIAKSLLLSSDLSIVEHVLQHILPCHAGLVIKASFDHLCRDGSDCHIESVKKVLKSLSQNLVAEELVRRVSGNYLSVTKAGILSAMIGEIAIDKLILAARNQVKPAVEVLLTRLNKQDISEEQRLDLAVAVFGIDGLNQAAGPIIERALNSDQQLTAVDKLSGAVTSSNATIGVQRQSLIEILSRASLSSMEVARRCSRIVSKPHFPAKDFLEELCKQVSVENREELTVIAREFHPDLLLKQFAYTACPDNQQLAAILPISQALISKGQAVVPALAKMLTYSDVNVATMAAITLGHLSEDVESVRKLWSSIDKQTSGDWANRLFPNEFLPGIGVDSTNPTTVQPALRMIQIDEFKSLLRFFGMLAFDDPPKRVLEILTASLDNPELTYIAGESLDRIRQHLRLTQENHLGLVIGAILNFPNPYALRLRIQEWRETIDCPQSDILTPRGSPQEFLNTGMRNLVEDFDGGTSNYSDILSHAIAFIMTGIERDPKLINQLASKLSTAFKNRVGNAVERPNIIVAVAMVNNPDLFEEVFRKLPIDKLNEFLAGMHQFGYHPSIETLAEVTKSKKIDEDKRTAIRFVNPPKHKTS
jgi:hypothetical protein